MKTYSILIIIFSFVCLSSFAQNKKQINHDNYYSYYLGSYEGKSFTTNWLRKNEVIPIILEELKKFGFGHSYENRMYEISDGNKIVLAVYNPKYRIGFLYHEIHHASPDKSHREITIDNWVEYSYTQNGELNSNKITSIPDNIHILQETHYWYQYNQDKFEKHDYVDREFIIEILKKDIFNILSKYKDIDN